MTRGALLSEIGRRLVELKGSEAMWDPTERIDTLNEAQRRMVKRWRLLRKTSVADTAIGVQDYSLTTAAPVGFGLAAGAFFGTVRPGLVYYDGTQDTLLTLRSLEWLYERIPNWRNEANGDPRYYFPAEGGSVFNDKVSSYPKPSKVVVGGWRLSHLLAPAAMTEDTHQPFNTTASATIQFPSLAPFHYALVWLSCVLLLQDDDAAKAQVAAAQYQQLVREANAEVFAPDAAEHARGGIAVVSGYRARGRW